MENPGEVGVRRHELGRGNKFSVCEMVFERVKFLRKERENVLFVLLGGCRVEKRPEDQLMDFSGDESKPFNRSKILKGAGFRHQEVIRR